MSHIQFNRDTRIELGTMLGCNQNHSEAARKLGMNRSSVSNEIKRYIDDDGIYRGSHAHKKYLANRKRVKQIERKIENNKKLRRYIVRKLKLKWSPEQIAGRLNRIFGYTVICHETIYTFVYEKRKDLVKHLRHQKSKYRKKRGTNARIELNKAAKIRRIDERPDIVDMRTRIGDWEDDTIVGKEKTQRVWSCVERKSGYAMADKLEVVSAEILTANVKERFKKIPKEKRKTLTRDNGSEFGDYDKMLEEKTGMELYRANAYCSWERGSNENWNGLFRQFYPKGTYFATITQHQVQHVVRMLNDRPRKRLGYRTPSEVFRGCCDSD